MTRRVDKIECVFFPILGLVVHLHCMEFDGNAALLLQVHIVQDLLVFHFSGGNSSGLLKEAVRDRGLPVVNVGNNAEITCVIHEPSLHKRKVRPILSGRTYGAFPNRGKIYGIEE